MRVGTPKLTPNHLSRKVVHPSCENPNEAPDFGVTPNSLAKKLGRLEKRKENEVIVI